jgi:hypothetical protein
LLQSFLSLHLLAAFLVHLLKLSLPGLSLLDSIPFRIRNGR